MNTDMLLDYQKDFLLILLSVIMYENVFFPFLRDAYLRIWGKQASYWDLL